MELVCARPLCPEVYTPDMRWSHVQIVVLPDGKIVEAKPGNRKRRNKTLLATWLILVPPFCVALYFLRDGIASAMQALLWAVYVGLVISNLVAVTDVAELVSADILEHAHKDRIQSSLKNNWTNTAVIAALLFGMVASYAQPKSATMTLREFPGGRLFESKFGFQWNEIIQYQFYICSCLAFMEYLIAILLAAMHLQWTDGLAAEHMYQYPYVFF